jgi:hypothetical protein
MQAFLNNIYYNIVKSIDTSNKCRLLLATLLVLILAYPITVLVCYLKFQCPDIVLDVLIITGIPFAFFIVIFAVIPFIIGSILNCIYQREPAGPPPKFAYMSFSEYYSNKN